MRMHVLQNLGGEPVYYVSLGILFSYSDSQLPEHNEFCMFTARFPNDNFGLHRLLRARLSFGRAFKYFSHV